MACSKEAVLELKDVVLAVKEVTRWYEVGLQLGLPEEKLKLISSHPDIEGHQRMMLSKWLSYDPEASWTKLVAALRAIGERSVADKVARQFVGVAVDVSRPDRSAGQDPETRLAMTKSALVEIKSAFASLLIEVRSALEKKRVKVKDVRQFFLGYFEGKCTIPERANLSKIFESITSEQLWRYDHYDALQKVAEAFLPKHPAVGHVTEYISKLAGFNITTSIIDFVNLSELEDSEEDNHPFSPKKYNRSYRKLTVGLKLDRSVKLSELTLVKVDEIWKALQKKFNLPSLTAVVDKIVEGSLKITWLILPHVEKRLRALVAKSVDFFRHHNIISVDLYDGLLPLYDEGWMEGSTPLFQACFAGNSEEVGVLLEGGANANENANGDTPLIGACLGSGDVDTVRLLVKHKANVDLQDEAEWSALMAASAYGHTPVVEVLLEYRADVNLQSDVGNTALICASLFGHTGIALMLLRHGATVDQRNKEGYTALMQGSGAGHTDTVQVLLQHGASVDLTNNDGGVTALMAASKYGQTEVVRVLMEHGASVNIKDSEGATALWWASDNDHSETAELLVKFGAQVDLPFDEEDGGTALTVACRKGHAQTAVVLLALGATVDYPDEHGQTPLHRAAITGHTQTVNALLENKAGVDIQDEHGWTALFLAAQRGHEQVAKVLLDHGATVDIKSKSGLTAFDIARDQSHQAVCDLLKERGAKVNPELTEAQRSEVTSVSERILYQLKKIFLREVMEKKERTGQLTTAHTAQQAKGRRSLGARFLPKRLRMFKLFTRFSTPAPIH